MYGRLLSIVAAASLAISSAFSHFVRAILSIVPASPRLVLAGGHDMHLSATGSAIDSALQHDMRHEAGVSRRSADRHI